MLLDAHFQSMIELRHLQQRPHFRSNHADGHSRAP